MGETVGSEGKGGRVKLPWFNFSVSPFFLHLSSRDGIYRLDLMEVVVGDFYGSLFCLSYENETLRLWLFFMPSPIFMKDFAND